MKHIGWTFESNKPMEIREGKLLSLIDKFPRAALRVPPERTPIAKQARTNMPGSGSAELIEKFKAKITEKQFNKGKAIDEMLTDCLAS
ncbi:hypothetical protein [Rhodococcus sp. ACPA1]|uniref:hypothetical protein n=2 Tax=Nocardiaceae TaxID=85025 RepID=UPI000B14A9C9|nr:hypothetical protein [Rhodococcus sp. ACPA1]